MRRLRDDFGVTELIAAHYLEVSDSLAARIMVMDHRRIVANDTPDALKAAVSGDTITLSVDGDPASADQAARGSIEIRSSRIEDGQLYLTVERGAVLVAPLLRALDAANLAVQSIT